MGSQPQRRRHPGLARRRRGRPRRRLHLQGPQRRGRGRPPPAGSPKRTHRGGRPAPPYLYVRAEHQGMLRQPIWGWLGRADPFAMAPGYVPGPGIAQMLSGTPPVLGLVAAATGIDLVAEAGIDAIRRKSVALTDYAIA